MDDQRPAAACEPARQSPIVVTAGSVARRGLGRAFGRSRSGVSAVEFALVAPMFLVALVEILQGGFYMFCAASLEKATSEAARAIMIGGLTSQSATAAGFRTNLLCPALVGALSCSRVVTSLQTTTLGTAGGYGAFVKADLSDLIDVTKDNTKTSYCAGAAGAYQYLQVFYAMPVFSPFWKALASTTWNGGSVNFVRSAAAFRNEPFTTTSVVTGC